MGTVTVQWMTSQLMTGFDSNGQPLTLGFDETEREPARKGVKPSDLLLLAAASCSAYDVVLILQKQRQPLLDLEVTCQAEQMDEPPHTFTSLHLHYKVVGDIPVDKVERAIQLSEEKYCSVLNTLKKGLELSSDFEVVEA